MCVGAVDDTPGIFRDAVPIGRSVSIRDPLVHARPEAIMSIEGTIVQIMESWPLQLVIETEAGQQHVVLAPDAAITARGQTVLPEKLKAGVKVRIEGVASESNGMTATAVTIEQND